MKPSKRAHLEHARFDRTASPSGLMQAIDVPPPKESKELRYALEEEELHQACRAERAPAKTASL